MALWSYYVEKRTASMELKAIRDQLLESPPPPPSGTSVREWFAGLALSNPALMKDVEPAERVQEAVRLADELLRALVQPRVPRDLDGPSTTELRRWEERIASDADASNIAKRALPTTPPRPKRTAEYDFSKQKAIVTSPETPATRAPAAELPTFDLPADPPSRRSILPTATAYSTVNPDMKPETPFAPTARPKRRPTRT